jgi:hypothetical protein
MDTKTQEISTEDVKVSTEKSQIDITLIEHNIEFVERAYPKRIKLGLEAHYSYVTTNLYELMRIIGTPDVDMEHKSIIISNEKYTDLLNDKIFISNLANIYYVETITFNKAMGRLMFGKSYDTKISEAQKELEKHRSDLIDLKRQINSTELRIKLQEKTVNNLKKRKLIWS